MGRDQKPEAAAESFQDRADKHIRPRNDSGTAPLLVVSTLICNTVAAAGCGTQQSHSLLGASQAQQKTMKTLIDKAKSLTDCKMSQVAKNQRRFRQQAQCWRLSYAEMHRRHVEVPELRACVSQGSRCPVAVLC